MQSAKRTVTEEVNTELPWEEWSMSDGTRSERETSRGIAEELAEEPWAPAASAGLFVGVRTFDDTRLRPVACAADDAVDLAYLFSCDLGLLDPERVWLALTDGEPQKRESRYRLKVLLARGTRRFQAHRNKILSRLNRVGSTVQREGLLVVSFATHGVSDGQVQCLAASDTYRSLLRATGLEIPNVQQGIEKSKAQRKLLIVDACHEIVLKHSPRGVAFNPEADFLKAFTRAKGLVSISAAPKGGLAYDDPVEGNGVFSSAILRGLRGEAAQPTESFITPDTLVRYVEAEVSSWNLEQELDDPGLSVKLEGKLKSLPLASSDPEKIQRRKQRERRVLALMQLNENLEPPFDSRFRDQVRAVLAGDELDQRQAGWEGGSVQEAEARALFRRGFALHYGFAERKLDYERARHCYRRAGDMGGPVERVWLADLLLHGYCGFAIDRLRANLYLENHLDELERLATEQNDAEATLIWGIVLSQGLGRSKDIVGARQFLERLTQLDSGKFREMSYLQPMALHLLGWLASLPNQPGGARHQQGLQLSMQAAEYGNATAMNNVAYNYEHGQGTEKDLEEAKRWFRMAAEKGHPGALIRLGRAARYGTWAEPSISEAIAWFRQAAQTGDGQAMHDLGSALLKAPSPAEKESLSWLRKSVHRGNTDGMVLLGAVYADGNIVDRNHARTIELWERAAEYGNGTAPAYLAELLADLGHAEEAYEWQKRAAELGDLDCIVKLGHSFYSGERAPADYQAAARWYLQAAEAGSASGQTSLAICYFNGQGVEQDHGRAAYWHARAAEQGASLSMYYLGQQLLSGQGVTQDVAAGNHWMAKAKAAGLELNEPDAAPVEREPPKKSWLEWFKSLL